MEDNFLAFIVYCFIAAIFGGLVFLVTGNPVVACAVFMLTMIALVGLFSGGG